MLLNPHASVLQNERKSKNYTHMKTIQIPTYLTKDEIVVWNRITPLIKNFSETDIEAVATYCQIAAIHQEAINEMHTKGMMVTGYRNQTTKNPAWTIINSCLPHMNSFYVQFGLSPAARAKMSAEAPSEQDTIMSVLDLKKSLLGKYEQRT